MTSARDANARLAEHQRRKAAERQSAHVGGSLAESPMLRLRCSHCGEQTTDPGDLNAVCRGCRDGVYVRGVAGLAEGIVQ